MIINENIQNQKNQNLGLLKLKKLDEMKGEQPKKKQKQPLKVSVLVHKKRSSLFTKDRKKKLQVSSFAKKKAEVVESSLKNN